MTIGELQRRCYTQAVDKGFSKIVSIPEQVALAHSELSEALESYRNDEPLSWTDKDGKPCGVASEFADTIIRLMHYMESMKLDAEHEIIRKLDYNLTRAHKHGGKLI